ncbi:hypothetical protein ACQP10_37990 (plasmid) [Streptosporangium sandarakinum]|uniref:hypothetical protein n=1 Tax=Streptosporangium sandarakinum TaxID=1260955 RepID=UPI003D8D3C03
MDQPVVTPSGDTPAVPEQAPMVSQAAPLAPPAGPAAPPPPVSPPLRVQMIATPGAEFVDLLWDNGELADPDALFEDPGAQYGYVIVAKPLIRAYHQPGTTRTTKQLWRPQGWKVPRDNAEQIKADLTAIRAAAAAD